MDYPLSPLQFVKENIIPAKKGRKCIDGRYEHDDYSGMIARPGADFGYVMAMLGYNDEQKLGLSVEECVKHVYEAVIEIDSTFYMHTDENSDSPYLVGCRHVTKSMDPDVARTYGLNPTEIQHAVELLKQTEQMPVTMVPVTGESQEEGILIIKNDEYTVNSRDNDHMYFIYDKKRDDLFIKELVEKIAVDELVYENFQRVSTLQLGATLQALAKGLPIFEVTIDESQDIQVTNTGTV